MGARDIITIKRILDASIKSGGFGRHLSRVEVIGGGNGTLTAAYKVEKEDCNPRGTLHGAFSALLVDNLSGIAMATHPNFKLTEHTGASININMTYFKAIGAGEEILIKSTTDRLGKRLAFLSVDILNRKNGDLIARGSHVKFIG